MESNHRPSGYEPNEVPLLYSTIFGGVPKKSNLTTFMGDQLHLRPSVRPQFNK